MAKAGDHRAIARLCSIIERDGTYGPLSSLDLVGREWTADVIAITGAPGVGKSTLVARLIALYRRKGARVAVLAIDPSSPLTGGALLGDRVRLDPSDLDDGVFFRSIADHGHRGGVSTATGGDVAIFDACGFDVVLVETVGAGQSDIDVRSFVDTVVVVCAPGGGDEIQALKAGILEIGDIFVVSKSDLDGATRVARYLREMVALGSHADGSWRSPVVSVSTLDELTVSGLMDELEQRSKWLELHVPKLERARRRAQAQVVDAAVNLVSSWIADDVGHCAANRLGDRVAVGDTDLHVAARELLVLLLEQSASRQRTPSPDVSR